jgi:ribosome biogenesis GTPase A
VPRALQVLSGSYPIAQLRNQLAVLRYLAERCVPALHVAYKLSHDADAGDTGGSADGAWSPWALCEALAEKKGFHTRGGAPDVARAANYFLRAALNGDPPLVFLPPGHPGGYVAEYPPVLFLSWCVIVPGLTMTVFFIF